MSSDVLRFLGFAFAKADFLMEIDRDGKILFAAGATAEFAAGSEPIGLNAASLFEPQAAARFTSQIRMLAPGGRVSLKLPLVKGGNADVALFRLPQNPERISCALSLRGKALSFASDLKDEKTGLATTESFLDAAANHVTENDALTLLNVPGLPKICAGLPPEQADDLLAAIGRSITSSGAKAAGRLSETSFGAIADALHGPKSQIAGVRAAIAERGLAPAMVQEMQVAMKGQDLRPEQRILALRYVVDRFTSAKRGPMMTRDLGEAFDSLMDETQERVREITDTVAEGAFDMAYQPIKDLKTLELSHFEALARFAPGQTAETVMFVEKLGISDSFDLAVAMKVITAMENDNAHAAHVAFNVSGHTIQSSESFGMLTGLLNRKRKLAPRLLIEVTETAEITDLEAGARAIATLRGMGFRVGLDDFGSGAATLNYLHAFEVDFVKFDGSLVRKLGASARDDKLLTAMLNVCHDLGFTTIAECLETEEDIKKAREAGFDHGQGYALGKPDKIPAGAGMSNRPRVRRKGFMETWQ